MWFHFAFLDILDFYTQIRVMTLTCTEWFILLFFYYYICFVDIEHWMDQYIIRTLGRSRNNSVFASHSNEQMRFLLHEKLILKLTWLFHHLGLCGFEFFSEQKGASKCKCAQTVHSNLKLQSMRGHTSIM